MELTYLFSHIFYKKVDSERAVRTTASLPLVARHSLAVRVFTPRAPKLDHGVWSHCLCAHSNTWIEA